ncbi:MAG: hypothetical protein HON04_08500 [Planctomicrobium sp.]|jgi:hypothetical protein|nr:hypothetical protein [Planctomicrobium sp.]
MKETETKQSGMESAGYLFGAVYDLARPVFRGKHMSAAIIVLASAILLVCGSLILHSGTRLLVQGAGCLFGTVGLFGWVVSSSNE